MGGSQSREGRLSDSDDSDLDGDGDGRPDPCGGKDEEEARGEFHTPPHAAFSSLDLNMASLSLNAKPSSSSSSLAPAIGGQKAKLYRHVGGNAATAQWTVAEKLVNWAFVREKGEGNDEDEDEDEEEEEEEGAFRSWILAIGGKVKARADERLQMKYFDDQRRVDFVHKGVWALKFLSLEDYKDFVAEYQNCAFENTYFLEANEENKVKVFGKDFLGWAKPNECDDSVWEDAEDSFEGTPVPSSSKEIQEASSEPASAGGIKSLTMGALDHSFLVGDGGIEAVRNMSSGIRGKGISVQFGNTNDSLITPKKAMLIRGESNMMILSPAANALSHSAGLHQLDIGTGKVVAGWKFEKDGTPISMRDVTNDSKGAQLDPSGSTFLGLDDNRLCRWDMRDRHGIVQDIASPVLNWTEGHQFSRGTNFRCFASTGDGAVAIGSKDGKIRLYGTTSMRMAKTVFPGLGSPITHVDVTYDGKWVLGTTDTYLILVSTVFKDKDGRAKTGFTGRMGNNMSAPRLLKLTPLDAYLAGKDHEFRGGQFSWVTESGRQERHLVATVGKFSVIWNFRRVKDSNHSCYQHADGLKSCYCYKIVPRDESIVDSKFMHDNFVSNSPEAPLVVATPKNVSSFSMWRE